MRWLDAVRVVLGVYAAGAREILAQLFRRCRGGFVEPEFPPQPGRVALITGGSEGIGFATAKRLARLGMHVIIAANDDTKGPEAARQIRKETLSDSVEFLHLDLGSLSSVREFAWAFVRRGLPLHLLICNAGVMLPPPPCRRPAGPGFEEHLATNFLGHFLLVHLLLGPLGAGGGAGRQARVLVLGSAVHRAVPRGAVLHFRPGPPALAGYAVSKLALVLFAFRLHRLLGARGVPASASVVDPGVAASGLFRHAGDVRLLQALLGRLLFKTPDEAAWTTVHGAVAPELEAVGGLYLHNEAAARALEAAYDPDLQRRLWAQSCELVGIPDLSRDLE